MLERKIINKGQGFRITSSGPWDNQSETLVVAMPKTRSPQFRVHPVKSIGVVGQTQLTFDSLESAQQYLDTFPDWRNTMSVGWTNKDYDCYKIPVVDGNGHVVDAWLSTRCFPEINTTQWGELKMMFPNYFTVELNEINESLNLTEEEISEIANDESLSDDEKCRKLWDTNFEEVKKFSSIMYLYYQDDIEKIRERLNNKELSWDDLNPVIQNLENIRDSRLHVTTYNLFIIHNESQPLTVKESFKGYTGGRFKAYSPEQWWGYVQLCIDTWKPLTVPEKAKKGFFTESYTETVFDTHETWKIKTPGSYCYRIKINIPNKRFRTFRWTFSHMTAYGGGPGWEEMCFLTKQEADQFIEDHRLNEQGVAPQQGWYSYSARVPLTLVKVPLLDGTEAYLRKEAFPREDTEEGQAWWSEMSQIYSEYFGKIKKGFFMENLDEALTVQKFNNLDNDLIKRIILQHVQKYGYMGGSYGNHNNNGTSYRGSPTVSEIIHILDSDEDLSRFACEPEVLTGMNDWVSELVPEGSYAEYETKCKQIWEKPHMAKEDLSMAASFCSRYFRNLEYMERQRQRQERERQHQAEIESESNVWAGQVGDQVSFVVREASCNYGIYGTMWTMKDTQGRTFTWGDSKGETKIEPNDKITGKIRQLTEFRGIKQTRIWRISITKSNGVKKGFFESVDTINSWLFKTTGLTEDDLDQLCDDNWEYRIDKDEPFMLHSEDYETGVVNPFYDDCGYRKYNLEDACKFWGESFIKAWIKYFIDWVKEHNYPIPQSKPHKGFFNE